MCDFSAFTPRFGSRSRIPASILPGMNWPRLRLMLGELRRATGMEEAALAERIGASKSQVYRIESGEVQEPGLDIIERWARTCAGLSLAQFFALVASEATLDDFQKSLLTQPLGSAQSDVPRSEVASHGSRLVSPTALDVSEFKYFLSLITTAINTMEQRLARPDESHSGASADEAGGSPPDVAVGQSVSEG